LKPRVATGQRQQGQVGMGLPPDPADPAPAIAGIDRLGQLADAAALRKSGGCGGASPPPDRARCPRHRRAPASPFAGHPCPASRTSPACSGRRGAPAQFAEHRAGLDRGELVLVAEQDQRAEGGRAASTAAIISRSTIDASSITSTSSASGLPAW
jgi:hypothetical protein